MDGRKKSGNNRTVSCRSDGPTAVFVNGVFLKSIWPEDTKALTPEEWDIVRDYVLSERKKLAERTSRGF